MNVVRRRRRQRPLTPQEEAHLRDVLAVLAAKGVFSTKSFDDPWKEVNFYAQYIPDIQIEVFGYRVVLTIKRRGRTNPLHLPLSPPLPTLPLDAGRDSGPFHSPGRPG